MKILFISANRVGDAVLTTGLLAWLEKTYPTARFTIACGPYGADLFRAVPRLDQLIIMRKKKYNAHWFGLWKQCVGTHWDLIVDLRNSVVSRLLVAKKRAIHSRGSGKHKVVDNGRVLGLSPPPNPYLWIADDAQREAALLIPRERPVLALGPAANWAGKQWPIEHFIDLTRELTQLHGPLSGATVMVLADTHERAQIEPLLLSIPDGHRIELIGQSLQVAAACLKQARLYIGNDSGLMHMAAALGTPTLGLFGPGFPHIYGPWGENCAYVRTPETRDELMSRIPIEGHMSPSLMGSLTVESALLAAKQLLMRTSPL